MSALTRGWRWAGCTAVGCLLLLTGCTKFLSLRVENRFSVPVTVVHVWRLPPLSRERVLMTVAPGRTGYQRGAFSARADVYRLSFRDPAGKQLAWLVKDGDEVRREVEENEWRLVAGPTGIRKGAKEPRRGVYPFVLAYFVTLLGGAILMFLLYRAAARGAHQSLLALFWF